MAEKVKVEDLKETSTTGSACCNCEEPKHSWGYHSYKLSKDFTTIKELQEAEMAFEKQQAEKELATAERKADAQKVEDARRAITAAREEAAKMIQEATENYYAARQQFIDKYGSYHETYTSNDNGITFNDFWNVVFGNIFDLFNS